MNIVTITSSGRVIVRPDTTWERDNEDVFLPEYVTRVEWSPVVFARISRPGRSIGKEFADRYYDGVGYGALLYPADLIDGSEEGFACASCVDHTSFLSFPVYNKVTLGEEGNDFEIRRDGCEIFRIQAPEASMLEDAIAKASAYVYLRTGDLLAVELQPRELLIEGAGSSCRLEGTFCENFLMDFNVNI